LSFVFQDHTEAQTLATGIHMQDAQLDTLTLRQNITRRLTFLERHFCGMYQTFHTDIQVGKRAIGENIR
jgi:hypothetical protein